MSRTFPGTKSRCGNREIVLLPVQTHPRPQRPDTLPKALRKIELRPSCTAAEWVFLNRWSFRSCCVGPSGSKAHHQMEAARSRSKAKGPATPRPSRRTRPLDETTSRCRSKLKASDSRALGQAWPHTVLRQRDGESDGAQALPASSQPRGTPGPLLVQRRRRLHQGGGGRATGSATLGHGAAGKSANGELQ